MTAVEDFLVVYMKTHPPKKGEKESKKDVDRRDK